MTRPPVEVRRATVDDLDDLLLLWAQAREELGHGVRAPGSTPAEQIRPRLREALTSPETHVLVARHDGVTAGYAVLRLAPVLAMLDGPALHIDHLYVTPQTRRRGVARALLVAATAIAERHGADQLLAGAPPSARESHRFLARLGFSPLVVRRVVGTATLRRRLAGEGQRRGLEDLLSRRRSLRARGLRVGWPGSGAVTDSEVEEEPVEAAQQAATGCGDAPVVAPVVAAPVGAVVVALPGEVLEGLGGDVARLDVQHQEALQIDLEGVPTAVPACDEGEVPLLGRRRRARA